MDEWHRRLLKLYSRIAGCLCDAPVLTHKCTFTGDNQTSRSQPGMWTKLCLNASFHAVQIVNNTLPYGAKPQACSRASFPCLRFTEPRCRIISSWNHIWERNHKPFCLHLSCAAGGRERVYIHVAYLSIALLRQPPFPPPPPVSSGVNTPGETNRWMTWKKAGFVPCEVILAPDPNPQDKEIHHPVRRSPTKTGTSLRYPPPLSARLPACLPAVLCSLRLLCALVSLCRGRPPA